jgi:hypothetical protein
MKLYEFFFLEEVHKLGNGRPVGTRTPDLYRVNSPSEVGEDEKK